MDRAPIQTIPKTFSYLCSDHARLQYLRSHQLYHIYQYKSDIILISKSLTQLPQLDRELTSQRYLTFIEEGNADFQNHVLFIKGRKTLNQRLRGRTQLMLEGYNTNFKKMLDFDRQNSFLINEDYLMRWWRKFKQMAIANVLCYQLNEQNLVVNDKGEFVFLGFAKLDSSQQQLRRQVKKQNYQFFLKYFKKANNNEIKQEIQNFLRYI